MALGKIRAAWRNVRGICGPPHKSHLKVRCLRGLYWCLWRAALKPQHSLLCSRWSEYRLTKCFSWKQVHDHTDVCCASKKRLLLLLGSGELHFVESLGVCSSMTEMLMQPFDKYSSALLWACWCDSARASLLKPTLASSLYLWAYSFTQKHSQATFCVLSMVGGGADNSVEGL